MGKRLKELCDWVEHVGYSSQAWIGGDWHIPLHLLSKLMANELEMRRKAADLDVDSDITLKINFDSMVQLAEDTLGIPVLISERDLLFRYPNIYLALLTYLTCMKHTVEHFDAKAIKAAMAPRLVFEARSGGEGFLPKCPSCNEHVFIIERVVVERSVWHRQCFKCTECCKQLGRGAFKKSKHGYECISHAVRRILDAHESSSGSGSGTYDKYGVRLSRPTVAPPPRPKPKPPPKPKNLSQYGARPDPVYESLEDVAQPSSSSTAQGEVRYDSIGEGKEESRRDSVEEKKDQKQKEPDTTEYKEERKDSKDEEQGSPVEDSSSGSSCDSGVVLRMARLFSGEEPVVGEKRSTRMETRNGPVGNRVSQPPIATSPVAPPRKKRTSMLLTPGEKALSFAPSPSTSGSSTSPRPQSVGVTSAQFKPKFNLEDYPDYLCPFGDDDETTEEASDYPESKNPFADSDDESSKEAPLPAPRALLPPVPVLPGTSDRPKSAPPPPPPGAKVDSSPPVEPRPARTAGPDSRIHTLRISKKKRRAPLPPVPQMRKINFTEKGVTEDPATITKRLTDIEEQMNRIEAEGRAVEKELLFQIATNPTTWTKSRRTEDWIEVLSKKLELMREQLYFLGLWREMYLNDVHAETEYYIRCLLEKDNAAKSEWEIEREATLTNLLISIIDEKLKLDECMADIKIEHSEEATKASQKKNKLKKRLSMLTKRMKHVQK